MVNISFGFVGNLRFLPLYHLNTLMMKRIVSYKKSVVYLDSPS